MRAMILAAGRGRRLRPLSDSFPKPLLQLKGKSLLEHQIIALHLAGIEEICINLHWLGEQIHHRLCHIQGVHWQWEETLLDTGGGIARALPWLCARDNEFVVVNADIYHNFPLSRLTTSPGARLVLAPLASQPDQTGDFGISPQGLVIPAPKNHIYTGMARLHRDLFGDCPQGKAATPFALIKILRPAIATGALGAIQHNGQWNDLGTLKRLYGCTGIADPEGNALTGTGHD